MTLYDPTGKLLPLHLFKHQLRNGADPNELWFLPPDHRNEFEVRIPLLSAIKRDEHSEAYLEALLEDGRVDLEVADFQGWTALHLAASYGRVKCVERLLEEGAEPSPVDIYGCTPLHFAGNCEGTEVMQLLLDAGADVNAVNQARRTPLHELLMVYTVHPKPLEEKVALLLDHRAHVDPQNEHGMTPLYMAALSGWDRVVAMLLEAGADPEIESDYLTHEGKPVDAIKKHLSEGAGTKEAALRKTLAVFRAHDFQGRLGKVSPSDTSTTLRRAM